MSRRNAHSVTVTCGRHHITTPPHVPDHSFRASANALPAAGAFFASPLSVLSSREATALCNSKNHPTVCELLPIGCNTRACMPDAVQPSTGLQLVESISRGESEQRGMQRLPHGLGLGAGRSEYGGVAGEARSRQSVVAEELDIQHGQIRAGHGLHDWRGTHHQLHEVDGGAVTCTCVAIHTIR